MDNVAALFQINTVSRLSRLRVSNRTGILFLVAVVQAPLVAAAAFWGVWPALAAGIGVLVSLPVTRQLLRSPWDHRPRSTAHKFLVMWPFYAWWTLCLIFLFTAFPLLAVAAVSPLTAADALMGAFACALVGAFRALRARPRVVKKRLVLPHLSRAFDGTTIVQLSDIHCGPFTSAKLVRAWVKKANSLRPDLIVVTGDLITTGTQYIDEMAAALGELKAPLGVFACLGNHDHFGTDGQVGPALQRHGIHVLDNRGVTLRRPGGNLYIAGVDDNWSGRDDLKRAMQSRPANAATVLLAHDPNLFGQAVAANVDLTLSGHTHGGQFAVPWMVRKFNLARWMTPFSSGLYHQEESLLYVSHGLGTSGPPIRLGARAELAHITLVCGAESHERNGSGTDDPQPLLRVPDL